MKTIMLCLKQLGIGGIETAVLSQSSQLIKKGYRISEIDVKMNEREGGTSSIKSWKNIYYMINVVLSILIIGSRRQK